MPNGIRIEDAAIATPVDAVESKDERKAKAERLANSQLLDVHKSSEYQDVNNAVNALYGELRELPEFKGNRDIRKKHIKVVVLDLYAKWLADPERYVSYHRMKTAYKAKSRYNEIHISYITVSIVDALRELDYVEHHIGYFDHTGRRSRISRMRATEKLISLIRDQHHVELEMIETHPNRECIVLRDQDKVDIEYEDTDETNQMRTELQAHNDLLRETSIELVDAPADSHQPIDYSDRFVRRIFNDSRWDHGGRFYGGWWQRIPSSCRDYIEINGVTATERDYSGLHIVLLYARQEIRYWQEIGVDPYTLDGYEQTERMRNFLKELLLTALNAESVKAAKQAIQYQINFEEPSFAWVKESNIDLDEIIDAFMQKHEPIREEFFTGYGTNLQYYDSLMAEYVINELTSRGLPVLCVHDSFVVKKYDLVTLDSLMRAYPVNADTHYM